MFLALFKILGKTCSACCLVVSIDCATSVYLAEMEERGQSVDVESADGVAEQQHSGGPPLQSSEGEALDRSTEERVGVAAVGQLSDEGENGHAKTDSPSVQRISGESSHGGEERDGDKEGSCESSDDEEGKSQNGTEGTPSAVTSSAKPTRLVQLPLARVKK